LASLIIKNAREKRDQKGTQNLTRSASPDARNHGAKDESYSNYTVIKYQWSRHRKNKT